MSKSILCTIDFSDSSLHALKWAADLAARYKCHLTVLYPYRLIAAGKDDVSTVKGKNEEMALRKFGDLEKDYLTGKVPTYDFAAEVGFMTDRVNDHLRKNSILMVVIGKNMDSTTQENLDELINHINVPILILP